jgi:uncharacterized protein (TIGR01244 family)
MPFHGMLSRQPICVVAALIETFSRGITMIRKLPSVIAVFGFCFCTFAYSQNTVEPEAVLNVSLKNMANPAENIFIGGQPTKEQLVSLEKQGIKHVINLRPSGEQNWDERQYVTSLGLSYHLIPVEGASGITEPNAILLAETLRLIGDEPVLLHCASGNRVGALIALGDRLSGAKKEAAIAKGKQWGLTGLEPIVREKLKK